MDDDAPVEEIKRAYRALAKECHPDFLGDKGHNICILLNEVRDAGRVVRVVGPAARRERPGRGLSKRACAPHRNRRLKSFGMWAHARHALRSACACVTGL